MHAIVRSILEIQTFLYNNTQIGRVPVDWHQGTFATEPTGELAALACSHRCLCSHHHVRVIIVLLTEDRRYPVYRSTAAQPDGQYLFLFYIPQDQSWAIGPAVDTTNVLAYASELSDRPANARTWLVKTAKGTFEMDQNVYLCNGEGKILVSTPAELTNGVYFLCAYLYIITVSSDSIRGECAADSDQRTGGRTIVVVGFIVHSKLAGAVETCLTRPALPRAGDRQQGCARGK